jgi:hypothetical protein
LYISDFGWKLLVVHVFARMCNILILLERAGLVLVLSKIRENDGEI